MFIAVFGLWSIVGAQLSQGGRFARRGGAWFSRFRASSGSCYCGVSGPRRAVSRRCAVLCSIWRWDSPKAASEMVLVRWWFLAMPATCRSSMLMSECLRVSRVVGLCGPARQVAGSSRGREYGRLWVLLWRAGLSFWFSGSMFVAVALVSAPAFSGGAGS